VPKEGAAMTEFEFMKLVADAVLLQNHESITKIRDYVRGLVARIERQEKSTEELIEEIESLEGYADEYRMDGGASEEEKNQQRADRRTKCL
jgi:hypothetical protein